MPEPPVRTQPEPTRPERSDSMFDDFLGLPLHPLVVHATVVLLPGASALALAYAAVPWWRWLLRWPLALAAGAAPLLTLLTLVAGQALQHSLGLPQQVVGTHESRAQLLLVFAAVFAVVGLVAAFTMGGPSLLRSGAGEREGGPLPVQAGVGVLLVATAVLLVVQVVLTGDAGSRLVYGAA